MNTQNVSALITRNLVTRTIAAVLALAFAAIYAHVGSLACALYVAFTLMVLAAYVMFILAAALFQYIWIRCLHDCDMKGIIAFKLAMILSLITGIAGSTTAIRLLTGS